MEFVKTVIPDVIKITPKVHGDSRGFFMETYSTSAFEKAGVHLNFIQDNHSLSSEAGTVRGLHYQLQPHAQTKLVRCTRGSIFDVAVDIRKDSPTFGRFVFEILSAENKAQLLVPKGFAHGFMTLEPNTEVQYKVDALYAPTHDRNILWNDPDIGIPWPDLKAILSEKDGKAPMFSNAKLDSIA